MKNRLFTLVGLAALLLFAASPLIADEFKGLERLMSEQQFKQAGMDKLSPQEIEVLNRWIASYAAGEHSISEVSTSTLGETAKGTHGLAVAPVQGAGLSISSTIEGQFLGWSGNTRFHLANGQVWQQRLAGTWKIQLVDPPVTIAKNGFGDYILMVDGYNRSISVGRVNGLPVLVGTATGSSGDRLGARSLPSPLHVKGKFLGWSGKTIFRLSNGQVWRQRLPGKWNTHLLNPKVKIEKNFLGYYKMTVVDKDRGIGVTRIDHTGSRAAGYTNPASATASATAIEPGGAELDAAPPSVISSHIKGEFFGWTGKTRFHLSNGQVWQQRLAGRWKTHLLNPEVKIEKNLFGFYKMTIEGQDRGIGVTRIN